MFFNIVQPVKILQIIQPKKRELGVLGKTNLPECTRAG